MSSELFIKKKIRKISNTYLVGIGYLGRRSCHNRSIDIQHIGGTLLRQRELLVGEARLPLHPLDNLLAGGAAAHAQDIRPGHRHVVFQPAIAIHPYGRHWILRIGHGHSPGTLLVGVARDSHKKFTT